MFSNNKNKSIIMLAAAFVMGVSIMSFSHQQPKHNFKILPQDISRDSLHNIMHGFNLALGVKCDFCHAKNSLDSTKLDFASDAKEEKETARYMMTMTDEINKKYFSDPNFNPSGAQVVTCATCHNGHEEPPKETKDAGH